MKMKPYIAHYMNKYPGGSVDSDGENYLKAIDAEGKLRVSLICGAGSVRDNSKMVGASDCHDLGPIPKDCRVYCDRADGLEKHKDAEARSEVAAAVAEKFEGRVPSVEEMCGEDFGGSHKFVEEFSAQKWMENGSVPAEKAAKKVGKNKNKK
ncbi:MAG: hypothetical protein AB7K68_17610 [Bacteriovoracia bacterium]